MSWWRSLQRSLAFTLIALIACAGNPCPGQTEPAKPKRGETSILILNSGRVVKGIVHRNAGGFLVKKPKGEMLVPAGQVRFQAESLGDGYRKLRRSMPEPSPRNHLALARWCLTHQLLGKAKQELRSALQEDPEYEPARAMLRRMQDLLEGEQVSFPQSQRKAGSRAPKVQSLGGLSPKVAEDFVTTVQPILLNKCGNASCHGPRAENDFSLSLAPRRHRLYAERNLATVLQYVDENNPVQSRLLVAPRGRHGGRRRPIFSGRGDAALYESLRTWVQQMAAAKSSGPTAETGERRVESGEPKAESPKSRVQSPESRVKSPKSSTRNPQPSAGKSPDLLKKILREEQPDAFDPSVFNRAVHGER